ncbi:hypothetical protein SSX86_021018 [Deinandra increscens subsp. villosa]|uniref:Putative plant transposon protein domain-containing protein n=1 Tax=Deinandra increscens subsp. villosa TaxID=3103831 RepID=A0AAP0GTZ0_9ASTR
MKKVFGRKGKGKAPAESSHAQEHEALKKRKLQQQQADEPEIVYVKQPWEGGPLTDMPDDEQPQLFIDKMNTLKDKKEGFICEKEVPDKLFPWFGVQKKFEALGWEAVLKCYDGEKSKLYMDEIEEWVSTLKLHVGKGPAQTKLTGWVNGDKITMSFESLNQIAKFDSKAAKNYVYPSLDDIYHKPETHPTWKMMLSELFLSGRDLTILQREDLKLKPKLIHLIMTHNVMPRRGDKGVVRNPEVPILYALMHGTPLVSFRYLVIYNIWFSRNSKGRKIVPYCRLIATLLKKAKAITADSVGCGKRLSPFKLENLGVNWFYMETDTHYTLRNSSGDRKWSVSKEGDHEDSGDEEDTEWGPPPPRVNVEEVNSGEDDEMHEQETTVGADVGGSRRIFGGSNFQYDRQELNPNWAHEGTMAEVIRNARPSFYGSWSGSTMVEFDHITRVGASQERAMKQMFDQQAVWNRANAYAFQQEINHRYDDDRQRRMHDQWHAGQEVVSDPPMIDYATLPPYDGSIRYPVPPLHHSQWIDPRQGQSSEQPPQQQGQGGAFGFGEFTDAFTQIFGPPHPRYY